MMKKICGIVLCVLLISLGAFALADVEINATNFPDENFREYVSQFDKDGNGSFSKKELAKVKAIYVYEKKITSLQGVEYFPALTKLECYGNQLTTLDLSGNTALAELDCGYNQLTSLDVSKNTALTNLDCSDNQITSLNTSKNTALIKLSCGSNRLTAQDDSGKMSSCRLTVK